jgi:hypothetical protein
MYIFALGTNAVMFAVTKKMMKNPIAQTMMGNFANMMHKNNAPKQHNTVPPTKEKPTAPMSLTHSPSADDPLSNFASMLGSPGGEGLFANLDMNKIMTGIGDLIGKSHNTSNLAGDFRGTPVSDAQPHVNEMKAVSTDDTDDIMSMLRQQEDRLQTIAETTPDTRDVDIITKQKRETKRLGDRLSFVTK